MNADNTRNIGKRGIRAAALHVGLLSALVTSLVPASATPAAAQQSCRKINSFDVCGRFLEEWSKQGSDQATLYVNGLTITARRSEISVVDGKSYDTQWFERAKFEAHPENKAPYDVLFGLLGTSLAEGRGRVDPYTKKVRNPADQPFVGMEPPADANGRTRAWFQETRHTISGKILEYWNRYGGLKQFGFPLSEPFQEISDTDGKSYTVQYFERNRFELHPEKAAPYEVELGLLGVQQYRASPVPGDKLPVAPPQGVKSSKDTLVIAFPNDPPSLYVTRSPLVFHPLWYDLQGVDSKDNTFPLLEWYIPTLENGGARMVGYGEDRFLQVKHKLRPGMKWSDGVEITSNDLIYAYKLSTH